MKTIKGPAIFLAQFMDDEKPFNNMENICKWVSKLGYKGVQIPTWDPRCIDLEIVAESKDFSDNIFILAYRETGFNGDCSVRTLFSSELAP